MIKRSLNFIAPHYTMRRMMDDYFARFYNKLAERSARIQAEGCALAKELVEWKRQVSEQWHQLEVLSVEDGGLSGLQSGGRAIGQEEIIQVKLHKGGLACLLDVELVIAEENNAGRLVLVERKPLVLIGQNDTEETYQLELRNTSPGSYKYAIRILPQHSELPHRQDFAYVRWVHIG